MDIDITLTPGEPVILAWFEDPEYWQEPTVEDAARSLWMRDMGDDWRDPLGIEVINEDGTGQWIPYADLGEYTNRFSVEERKAINDSWARQAEKKWSVSLRGPQEANTHDAEVATFTTWEEAAKVADQLRTRFGGRVTVNEINR